MFRRATLLFFGLSLAASACHCNDECRSAAECPSGICHDGRCVEPLEPADGGDQTATDASTSDAG